MLAMIVSGCGTPGLSVNEAAAGNNEMDSAITRMVKGVLAGDAVIQAENITVVTKAGIVTLHGHVHNQLEFRRAVVLVSGVDGVRWVDSYLEVLSLQ